MGWQYRKSIKIAPGVRINLSKKGVGYSAGIPGTGLRYVKSPGKGKQQSDAPSTGLGCLVVVGIILAVVVVANVLLLLE